VSEHEGRDPLMLEISRGLRELGRELKEFGRDVRQQQDATVKAIGDLGQRISKMEGYIDGSKTPPPMPVRESPPSSSGSRTGVRIAKIQSLPLLITAISGVVLGFIGIVLQVVQAVRGK
jgi:hypothetical protein